MTTFWTVYFGILLLFCVFMLWSLRCNTKTYTQRSALLDAWRPYHGTSEFGGLYREYREVTYGAHHWHLMTFRDPYLLYGPMTQKLIIGPREVSVAVS